jgi:hypothetical protein
MTTMCDELVGFIDGDLEPERTEAFREHLRSCPACQGAFIETLQMSVRLSELATPAQAPPKPPAKHGQHVQWILAAALVCTAAVAVLVLRIPSSPPPVAGPSAPDPLEKVDGRLDEVRLAYAGVSKHRQIRQMRGSVGSSQRAVSYDALAALQNANNLHGLAIAEAYNGNDLAEVAKRLRGLKATPEIRSDRAAIEMIIEAKDPVKRGTTLEALLEELAALKDKDDLAGRAARWNYALVLERLGLPLSAARAFRAIAAENEQGWSVEAATRADLLAQNGESTRTVWTAIHKAGEALSTSRTPIAGDLLRRSPGLARASLYDAVRTARSRDEVLALESMARELDGAGKPFLVNYVRRVAGLDFGQRKPLAGAYARLLKNELPPAAAGQLLSDSPSRDTVDIVMGAMNQQRVVADHIGAYRRMVKQTDDPWFQLILADAEAQVAARAGNLRETEARLRESEIVCSTEAADALSFQCLNIASDLADLYVNQHRLPEAVKVVRKGMELARRTGEWGQLEVLLWCLAEAARYDSSLESARAYANEILWMARKPDATTDEPSAMTREAHMILANLAIRDLNGPVARRELELALRNATPDLWMANVQADIGRLDPAPGDLPRLQQWLTALRSQDAPSPTQRILFDAIEGRLLIDKDPAAGIAMLERVIASTEAITARDSLAKEARSGSLSVLALEAARGENHARVLELLAQQLGVAVPGACTVGMVVEDARDAIVVQSSEGKLRGTYTTSRHAGDGPPVISAELARSLESCSHVGVIAEGMLQGQPHVLPPAIAWSFLAGARRPTAPVPTEPRAVIVANVKPPEDLQLPPLAPQSFASTSTTVLLSGLAATPTRVLSEIAGATEIQFHTHALDDAGVSGASHLVLSPDRDRGYALTAEAIRQIELRGRPIVVLAACDSGHRARYQHVPFSLPSAFLSSGARMVFAAGSAIPDSEAGAFFSHVLDSVHAGADPAVALRNERQRVLAEDPTSWVGDVVLFE